MRQTQIRNNLVVSGLFAIVALIELVEWFQGQVPIWVVAVTAATTILLFIGSKIDGRAQFDAKAAKMRERIAKSKEHQ